MTELNGYTIKLAHQTGGKAGKGHNKTSTVQVIKDNFIIKQFRYTVDNPASFMRASKKAIDFANGNA